MKPLRATEGDRTGGGVPGVEAGDKNGDPLAMTGGEEGDSKEYPLPMTDAEVGHSKGDPFVVPGVGRAESKGELLEFRVTTRPLIEPFVIRGTRLDTSGEVACGEEVPLRHPARDVFKVVGRIAPAGLRLRVIIDATVNYRMGLSLDRENNRKPDPLIMG